MFWLRLSGWLFVLLVIATAAVMFLGSQLPPSTTTSVIATIRASPDRLWPLLTDPTAQPHWRSDVSSINSLPDDNNLPCWAEQHDRTNIPVCIVAFDPPSRLILHTADARLPFQADRTFLLAPQAPDETRVTLTETTTITPPMVRFYNHYILHERPRLDRLLADLDHAATTPAPERPR